MEHKTYPVYVTKIDEEQGVVETVFAVMGNADKGGDVIHPGAFTKTFVEHGRKVKILDLHKTDSILRVLGKPLAFRELSRAELPTDLLAKYPDATGGAWASVQFNLQTQAGHDTFQHFKAGDIDEWSFGYDALQPDYTDTGKAKVRNLRALKLYELSPVIWGMNPATTTLSAKMETKPEPEETENSIRVRVRNPDDFQEGTFATIDIDKDNGIQAVIGRLQGETTTTIQTYIFSKDKNWTIAKAVAWVEEHKKSGYIGFDIKTLIAELGRICEIETKEGRVLSAANAERIASAVENLIQVLGAAGVDISKAGPDADTIHLKEAGPDDALPDLLRIIEIEQEQIKLLED